MFVCYLSFDFISVVSGCHRDNRNKEQSESLASTSPLFTDKSEAFSFPDMVQRFIGDMMSTGKSKTAKAKERTKMILKGISLYFNPGQLIAIMGPSGKNTSSTGKGDLCMYLPKTLL